MKILVITPTTGSSELLDAIVSVHQQSITVEHLLVVDGEEFKDRTDWVIQQFKHTPKYHDRPIKPTMCYLPYNTGGGGFYGHRIISAFGHLIPHDLVLFLDQDNWFEPNHVESLVREITTYDFQWAYSLRKIYDKDKEYLMDDNCESLGRWPAWVGDKVYLIDSSSYCFRTSFLRQVCHVWDYGWGADRRFYNILKDQLNHKNYSCTGKHTLCYRLGGNEGSVQKEFFVEGNQKMNIKYDGKFPWLNQFS